MERISENSISTNIHIYTQTRTYTYIKTKTGTHKTKETHGGGEWRWQRERHTDRHRQTGRHTDTQKDRFKATPYKPTSIKHTTKHMHAQEKIYIYTVYYACSYHVHNRAHPTDRISTVLLTSKTPLIYKFLWWKCASKYTS